MRYLEIDFARGIAVLLMIAYHFVFDIYFPNYSKIYFFAFPIASSFILISGICLHISYSRRKNFYRFLKRGIKLSSLSLTITALTFIFLEKGFIIFGILHFFAFTSFLIYPFLKYVENKFFYLLFGIFSILLGIFFSTLNFNSYYFLWLGIAPKNFFTFDYFPIFPWFGILLLGVFLGKVFYPNGKRSFDFNLSNSKIVKIFSFFGKHSLLIYFLHQPLIILILSLTNLTSLTLLFSAYHSSYFYNFYVN